MTVAPETYRNEAGEVRCSKCHCQIKESRGYCWKCIPKTIEKPIRCFLCGKMTTETQKIYADHLNDEGKLCPVNGGARFKPDVNKRASCPKCERSLPLEAFNKHEDGQLWEWCIRCCNRVNKSRKPLPPSIRNIMPPRYPIETREESNPRVFFGGGTGGGRKVRINRSFRMKR